MSRITRDRSDIESIVRTKSPGATMLTEMFRSPTGTMWMTLLAMSILWATVAIVRIIVDGIVKTRQQRTEMERECLTRVIQDLEEIKERLDFLKKTESTL
jgi:hypothetical protein